MDTVKKYGWQIAFGVFLLFAFYAGGRVDTYYGGGFSLLSGLLNALIWAILILVVSVVVRAVRKRNPKTPAAPEPQVRAEDWHTK